MKNCLKHNKKLIGTYNNMWMCSECLEESEEEDRQNNNFILFYVISGIISFFVTLFGCYLDDHEWHYILAGIYGALGPVGLIPTITFLLIFLLM